jgi:uncharacterized protein (UPF0297 family)
MEESEKSVRLGASHLRHREVLSRMVYHNQKPSEIASELGFSLSHIYRIVNSPLFQAELQKELTLKRKMERDAVIQSVADEGTKKLLEAVKTGKIVYTQDDGKIEEKVLDGREIVNIIHDSLDRTGHKPVNTVIEGHVDLGSMIIQAHKDAEAAKAEEDVIDVTPTPEASNEPETGATGTE